jgi:hypothetical protein
VDRQREHAQHLVTGGTGSGRVDEHAAAATDNKLDQAEVAGAVHEPARGARRRRGTRAHAEAGGVGWVSVYSHSGW